MIEQNHQFHRMLLLSICLHLIVVVVVGVFYLLRPTVEISSLSEEAPTVELYDQSDLPDEMPTIPEEVRKPEPEVADHDVVAFKNLSTVIQTPTPTPRPTATPAPLLTPTPTPTPKPTPKPTPTLRPVIQPRSTPTQHPMLRPRTTITSTPTPSPQETVIAFDVPRRRAVLDQAPQQIERRLPAQPYATPESPDFRSNGGHGPGTSMPGEGPSVMLDQEEAFPFPEYLNHIQEKIAGIWFPQGSGTVLVYLIIGRNGKILKSGVDKGEGLGVEKLRDSVIRALVLIKGFEPLPQEYNGVMLRVRITVRR